MVNNINSNFDCVVATIVFSLSLCAIDLKVILKSKLWAIEEEFSAWKRLNHVYKKRTCAYFVHISNSAGDQKNVLH